MKGLTAEAYDVAPQIICWAGAEQALDCHQILFGGALSHHKDKKLIYYFSYSYLTALKFKSCREICSRQLFLYIKANISGGAV